MLLVAGHYLPEYYTNDTTMILAAFVSIVIATIYTGVFLILFIIYLSMLAVDYVKLKITKYDTPNIHQDTMLLDGYHSLSSGALRLKFLRQVRAHHLSGGLINEEHVKQILGELDKAPTAYSHLGYIKKFIKRDFFPRRSEQRDQVCMMLEELTRDKRITPWKEPEQLASMDIDF